MKKRLSRKDEKKLGLGRYRKLTIDEGYDLWIENNNHGGN